MPKTYRVAVIGRTGRGNYGHGLDTAWKGLDGTELVAVADDNQAGLVKSRLLLGVNQAFLDYREMLDRVKPDIVAIAPRWVDQHAEMALAAAERGIHIYIEKPFSRTLAEADAVIAACERAHVKLAVAHPTRYSPLIDTVRRLIAEGKLGTVLEYRARGKEDRRGGGEDLWVLGTHMMDLIRAFGGHPEWCFARVTTDGHPVTRADVVEGAEGIGPLAGDAVHAVYGMPGGAQAYFASVRNEAANPPRYGLQIFGSKGVIEILEGVLPEVNYLADPTWSPGRTGSEWQNVSSAGIGVPEPLANEPRYRARHDLAIFDLIAAIEENREPLCGMYEARGAVEMIVAVFESHRQGGPVTLPLANRENPLTMLD